MDTKSSLAKQLLKIDQCICDKENKINGLYLDQERLNAELRTLKDFKYYLQSTISNIEKDSLNDRGLKKLKEVTTKAGVREHLNISGDWGYSQVERDIVESLVNLHKEQ